MSRHAVVLGALIAAVLAAPAWAAQEDGGPAAQPQAQVEPDQSQGEAEKEAPKVKATFLGEGSWATEEDCRNLRKLEGGAKYPEIERSPRLITAGGYEVGDLRCHFSKIETRRHGVYRAKLACRGGCESFTETMVFTPLPKGGGYAMSYATDKRRQALVRCEPKPKDVETN